jgi:hypothetical protein
VLRRRIGLALRLRLMWRLLKVLWLLMWVLLLLMLVTQFLLCSGAVARRHDDVRTRANRAVGCSDARLL